MDRPLGALTVLLALLVSAPAAAAGSHDPGTPGPPLVGTPVSGATDPADAPELRTGRYLDRLPGDDELHYRLPRAEDGSTFHVAVMFLGVGRSVGEGLRIKTGTTPGDQGCGSSGVFRPTLRESAPLLFTSVSTWTDVTDHECATADQVHLTVTPPSDPRDAGRRVQLLVYEEPPVSQYALDLLPTPTPPAWTPLEPGTAQTVTAGSTPTDAPLVGDGTHRLALEPGGTQVLAVPLDWEQTHQAQLDTVLPATAPADDQVTVDVVSPMLGSSDVVFAGREPADWTPGPAEGRRAYRTGAQSHVVSYVNRDSYDATVNTESLAGVHYVLVTWHSSVEQPAGRPLEATLTLQTSGTPGTGVPSYTEIDGLLPPAAGSRLVDGSLEAPPDDAGTTTAPAEDDEPLPWRVIGLAAAAATVALLALLRLTRRAGRAPGR